MNKEDLILTDKVDLLLGCIGNYDLDKAKNWVNSINMSGFAGDKAVIGYNLSDDVIEYLHVNDFKYFEYKIKDARDIVIQRFFDQWHLLNSMNISKYRYLIATDTRDVIFQRNPSLWLEHNLGDKKILVSSECLRFKDEVWSTEKFKRSFTNLYDYFSLCTVYNAGTIAGEIKTMKDLFLNIYYFSLSTNTRGSDQHALNILINLEHVKPIVKFSNQEEGWCAQLGTTMDPMVIEQNRKNLLEPVPRINDDWLVVNEKNIPFIIVHQYDRVPELSKIIDKRFGGSSIVDSQYFAEQGLISLKRIYQVLKFIGEPFYNYARQKNWKMIYKIKEKIKNTLQ